MAGNAGDDRPGHRERLLLRLRAQRAVHARRFSGHRKEDARDHRPQQTLHQGGLDARQGQAGLSRQGRALQGRTDRRHSRRPGPQDLCAGRLVRPLPRAAHGFDGPDRQRLQADEGGRRLLARRRQQSDADAHLRHRLGGPGRARRLSPHAGGGREARPPQARPRDGPVPFPGGGAGRRLLARQGLAHVPEPDLLHAPPPRRRLPGGQRSAGARQVAVGNVGPLGLVPGEHVRGEIRACLHPSRKTRTPTSASSR